MSDIFKRNWRAWCYLAKKCPDEYQAEYKNGEFVATFITEYITGSPGNYIFINKAYKMNLYHEDWVRQWD